MLSDAILPAAEAALPAARLLTGLWLALTSAHWLVAAPLFAPTGRLPWAHIAKERSRRGLVAARRRMGVAGWRAIFAVQLGIAVALVAGVEGYALIACLHAAIILFSAAIMLSGQHWVDGADKIGMVAMTGTLLTALGVHGDDPALALSGLLWTGGQLILCYAVAGVSKLFNRRWRDGRAITAILSTTAWGHPLTRQLMTRRGWALAASWGVMLLEALFPIALILPWPAFGLALAAMMLFHIATALFMGLNRFPWAFAAAYPAVLALGQIIGSVPTGG